MDSATEKFTLADWIITEGSTSSDLWIWKQITKHFAYGKGLPVQLGSLSNLNNLHTIIIDFIKSKTENSDAEDFRNYQKIKKQFETKESFDKFVDNIFLNWEKIILNFSIFYQKNMFSEKINTTDDFVKEFLKENQEITDTFKDCFCKETDTFCIVLKKLFNHLERAVWKTNSYYASPLFSALSYYAPWRWFYLLWFYYQLVLKHSNAQKSDYEQFFFDPIAENDKENTNTENQPKGDILSSLSEKISKDKLFILPYCQVGSILKKEMVNKEMVFFCFGPVFSPHEKRFFHDRATYRYKIKPSLLLFKIFQLLLNERTNKKFSKSLTEADIFLKACGTKPYIYRRTMKQHMNKIKILFDVVLETEIVKSQTVLEKSDRHILVLVSLLRWAIFISKTIDAKRINLLQCKFPYNFFINRDQFAFELFNITLLKDTFSFCIATQIKNNKINSFKVIEMSNQEKGLSKSTNGVVAVEQKNSFYKPITIDSLDWIENEFINFNSNFDIRTRTSKQPYLLAAWLRRHFYLQTSSSNEEFNEQHLPICKNICDLFDADAAVIYTYHHAEEKLKLIASWFAEKEDKRHEKKLAQRMSELSDQEKNTSICYRAVELNNIQFTLAFDPNHPKSTPPGYYLCDFADLQMRSAIAVPLLFKGRILGILEIAGKKEFQFGWTNREILNQTSIVLSTAFYQQRLVNALHKINLTALNLKSDNALESYNQICKYLSSIFLCDGSSLWYRSEKDPNKYQCHGAYNHDYITKQLKADASAVAYTAVDEYSMEAKMLIVDKKINTKTFKIGIPPLDNSWLKSALFRQKLEDQKIKYYTAFSVFDEKCNFCGSISLYDRNNIGYDDWDSMYIFISNFINVILEAANVFAAECKIIQAKNDHEIIGSSKAIRDRLERFFYLSKPIFSFYNAKENLTLFQDQNINSQDLFRKLKLVEYDLKSQKERLKGLEGDSTIVTKVKIEKISLSKHFNSARSSFFYELEKKDKSCTLSIPGLKQPLILIDKVDLTTILSNLISNAAKYSFQKDDIKASFEEIKPKSKRGWRFSITNFGYSLKREEEGRLFQSGFRSAYAERNEIKGAGMGLSIARDACDKYGIEIYHKSKKIADQPEICLHSFTLILPDVMVITD